MKLINKFYIICLLVVSIFFVGLFYNGYIKKNNVRFVKCSIVPGFYDNPERYKSYEFVSNCDSVDDAIDIIKTPVLKKYEYGDDIYIFVSEGIDYENVRGLLYKYSVSEKQLYKVIWRGSSIEAEMCGENYWYDYDFSRNLMQGYDGSYYHIDGGSEYADVYYGVWYGDEVKNIRFDKGKFEYFLLDTRENVYFWTYELKDSKGLLSKVPTVKEDPRAKYGVWYYPKDVIDLLGIKCKYSLDYRIVLYLMITIMLLVGTALLFVKVCTLRNLECIAFSRMIIWFLTVCLCAIVAVLITYYIYNPRLVFYRGGIGGMYYNLTGKYLPNPF